MRTSLLYKIKEEERILPSKNLKGNEIIFILAFPDIYKYGLPNLGIQTLYKELYLRDDVAVDRYYTDEDQPFSFEYGFKLKDSDFIGISFQYEGIVLNAFKILKAGSIPLINLLREENDPIIIGGGPVANYNPLPLSLVCDVIVLGEAEEAIHKIIDSYKVYRNVKRKRMKFLQAVSQIEGIYVPCIHGFFQTGMVKQTSPVDINEHPAHSIFVTKNTVYEERVFSIEVRRGCTQRCRFCYMGHRLKPPRTLRWETFKKIVDLAIDQCNVEIIKLFYEGLETRIVEHYLEYIIKKGGRVRIGSQRLEKLSKRIIEIAAISGQRKITVAPETSGRLRKVIGKHEIKDEEILEVVRISSLYGIPDFGLYFILAIPGETFEDLDKIADLIMKVRHQMNKLKNTDGRLEIGINPLYPKPFTPFQYVKLPSLKNIEDRFLYIVEKVKKEGFPVVISNDVVDEKVEKRQKDENENESLVKFETTVFHPISLLQPMISRGGLEIAFLLHYLHSKRFNTVSDLENLLNEFGINAAWYFEEYIDKYCPWKIQKTLISEDYLLREYFKALNFISTDEECKLNCSQCFNRCIDISTTNYQGGMSNA
ncbi:radical SAM protein [Thermotoga neapolitana]|uniref:Radical SAM domain protein n=1 Tax=Thermotoga neapolitana (strain ATCC 49049 / DSM 4359 / NBRC 107923 / NS-E) TaxID=309803 RepID=B9K8J5_THENN|nr:radical SAM protein [Thermotoga neapolitana]ACM23278.1 Radical SAM domain protein [Thermotoga neapolitana DSM 4359]KFZ21618.1 Radical SAM domain protein [Thermotoga neapolitana LA10]